MYTDLHICNTKCLLIKFSIIGLSLYSLIDNIIDIYNYLSHSRLKTQFAEIDCNYNCYKFFYIMIEILKLYFM